MPRARYINKDPRQTAAASEYGSGCLSVYWLPVAAAISIVTLLAFFALNATVPISALPIPPYIVYNISSEIPTSLPVVNTTIDTSGETPFFEISTNSTNTISPIFTKQVQHWTNDIVRWANAYSLDPNLVAVVMQVESCGDPRALSHAGAMGLFQVMPFHFHITDNPFNPDTNAQRGLAYLTRSLEIANGNARLALAGYNGGLGVIARSEWTWANETHRYVRYSAPIYEDARNGANASATLNEWYKLYGASLCRQASERLGILE